MRKGAFLCESIIINGKCFLSKSVFADIKRLFIGKTGAGPQVEIAEVRKVSLEEAEKLIGKDVRWSREKGASKTITSTLGNEIDITPYSKHISVNKNPGPYGEANTSVDILDVDGNIKTRRWYDSDGKAYRDVDMSNHGNSKEHPEVPHEHTWEYKNGKPKRN